MSSSDSTENAVDYDVLLKALKDAAAAHGVHEATELGGVFDVDWPQWYTHHMVKSLTDSGYRLVGPSS